MLRTPFLAAVLAALAVACVGSAAAAPTREQAPSATRVVQLETDVLAALNRIRRDHDLVPLKLSAPLSKAATAHSTQMASRGFFAHESADGTAFWKRVATFYPSRGAGYWSVGENLLWASPTLDASRALELWMASPEHRRNILTARWREIGVSAVQAPSAPGTYNGLPVTIVTTDFGVRR